MRDVCRCEDCGEPVDGGDPREPGLCPGCYDLRGIASREFNELCEREDAGPLNLHLNSCPKCCTYPIKLCPIGSDILQSLVSPPPEPFNPLKAACYLFALPMAAGDWLKKLFKR